MPPARRRPPKKTFREDEGKTNPAADPDHTPPVSTATGTPAAETEVPPDIPAALPAVAQAAAVAPALAIPDPDTVEEGEGDLSADEEATLTACETALDVFRMAFVEAGKALEVIAKGKLYRRLEGCPTFDDYVQQHWQMSPAQARRWINGWRLAVAISPIGEKNVSESHVRELLPVKTKHTIAAAVAVYDALTAQAKDRRVTAELIKGAVAALPAGPVDDQAAAEAVRVYLASLDAPAERVDPDPATVWAVQSKTLRSSVDRIDWPQFGTSARTNPAEARELVNDLMAKLQQVIEELGPDQP